MLRKIGSFICLSLLCVGVFGAPAQQTKGVGVVMSGGGAKGLYHIGVLEALEQNGIPIDYVAGTSMGSIVAALYAAGYSPAQMREIVASGVIKEWITGRIDPTKYKAYYRQYGHNPSVLNVRLDFSKQKGKRLRMPTNLISSTPIDFALTGLFSSASAAAKDDFDHLMVPFLCVASDINQRKGVVLRGGALNEAVRSSMSIPLVFKAMKIDSVLLYDGGIYDNFPWKPLDKEFRPSIIIGSICTEGTSVAREDNTLLDQAFLLAMQETDYNIPPERGVTIAREVAVSLLDFDSAVAVMNSGYADAMAKMPELLERIPQRWTPQQFEARREAFLAKCPPLIFDQYSFNGLTEAQQEYMRDFVKTDLPKTDRERQMGIDELRDNIYGVLADGDFTMEFPEVRYDPVRERYSFAAKFATKPNFRISVGGNVSSTAFNQAYIGVSYRTTGRVAHQIGGDLYLGPIYTWGTFGGRADFYMRKPVFLDYSFNFAVRNFRHGAFGNVRPVTNSLDVKNSEVFGSVAVGLPLTHRSLLMLRANGGHVNYHYDADFLAQRVLDHSRFSFFGLKLELSRNTLDKVLHPRRGSDLQLSAIFITGRDKYRPSYLESGFESRTSRHWIGARFSWDKYFDIPSCPWFSLGLNIDATITNHPDFSTGGSTLMSLPSYEPLSHMQMVYMPDYYAKRFVAGGLKPTFDLLPNFFFRLGAYAMYRAKRAYIPEYLDWDQEDRRLHFIAEASLVYHTPIGPVSLALTKYDFRNWNNMYLTFNFGYAIFAPKGTFY